MKSDRNPALASEHGGTWNKDNITYQNLGVKLRHEGNYLWSKEIEKKANDKNKYARSLH